MGAGNSGAIPSGKTQANPVTIVTIAGVGYRLTYDLGSLIGIYEDTRINFVEGVSVDARAFVNPVFLRDMLYHGLAFNHPDLTKQSLVHMVSIADLPHVVEKILEALTLSLSRGQAGGEGGEGSPEASAGAATDPPPPPPTLS